MVEEINIIEDSIINIIEEINIKNLVQVINKKDIYHL